MNDETIGFDWERLARTETHQCRVAIIEMMRTQMPSEEGWSPNALSRALALPLSNVAYHAACLREAGFLVLIGTAQRRGAIEHFYALASS